MLSILHQIPDGFLDILPTHLHQILPGPTLIHLQGNKDPALFVSVLLHGNETTGLYAIQNILRKYLTTGLPRSLSIFVGNVLAAKEGQRQLDSQPDYNRIWLEGKTAEHAMTQQVLEEMRQRKVFLSVDIHNNTGTNPHYACVNRLDHRFYHLALLFNRTVVYFTNPKGVQTSAFADLCPAVTLECGHVGDAYSIQHAIEYLEACMHLSEIPTHPVHQQDIDLYHTVGQIKILQEVSFGFGEELADLRFLNSLDHLNFTQLAPGTLLGWRHPECSAQLKVCNDQGKEVGENYFDYSNHEIRTRALFMPSMFTLNKRIIRQDCLGYVMERISI